MPTGVYVRKRRPVAERFWEKVDRTGECWEWTAFGKRYGFFGIGRKVYRTHRVAWELVNGPIPPGLVVMHRCDNTLCVRPDHLMLGTQADNVADMWAKKRGVALSGDAHPARRPGVRVGERNGRARLTPDDVRRIRQMRADGMQYKDIAAAFGVATPTVQHIVSRKNWAHVV